MRCFLCLDITLRLNIIDITTYAYTESLQQWYAKEVTDPATGALCIRMHTEYEALEFLSTFSFFCKISAFIIHKIQTKLTNLFL